MRGFGKSDTATGSFSRRHDLYLLLQELGINQALLLGCSMRGQTAIDFTLEHPEMVLSLTVISGSPGGFEMRGEPPPRLWRCCRLLNGGSGPCK